MAWAHSSLVRLFAAALLAAACGGAPAKAPADGGGQTQDTAAETHDALAPSEAAVEAGAEAPADTVLEAPAAIDATVDVPAGNDASTDAGPDGQDAGPSLLAQQLARTWTAYGSLGNCIEIMSWFTFGADGSVLQRDIDNNACSGPRLIRKLTGSYTLTDRVVEMTLDGLGESSFLYGAAFPRANVTKRIERFQAAVGVIAPPGQGNGHLGLDREAFTGGDGAHYQRERFARLDGAAGLLFEQRRVHSVTIDPPLPLPAGTPCKVDIDFLLTSFDSQATPATENGTFHVSYMAVVRAKDTGWLSVVPQAVDGLINNEAYAAWLGILNAAGFSQRTPRVQNAFGTFYSLAHPSGDTRVLSQSLPQSAEWREATKPPPFQ